MSLIQRDGAYKVHLANFSHQVGGGGWGGEGRREGHFENKEPLTRLEMGKESQYGVGGRAAGWHRGGGGGGWNRRRRCRSVIELSAPSSSVSHDVLKASRRQKDASEHD